MLESRLAHVSKTNACPPQNHRQNAVRLRRFPSKRSVTYAGSRRTIAARRGAVVMLRDRRCRGPHVTPTISSWRYSRSHGGVGGIPVVYKTARHTSRHRGRRTRTYGRRETRRVFRRSIEIFGAFWAFFRARRTERYTRRAPHDRYGTRRTTETPPKLVAAPSNNIIVLIQVVPRIG